MRPDKQRLGFLSATGVALAVVAVVVVAGWMLVGGPVMFSPGELGAKSGAVLGGVSSHAQLSRNCGACHSAPWSSQTMADKCLACHTEVTAQIQSRSGTHGRLLGAQTSPTCRGCHTDHLGAKGSQTVLNPAVFPHALTGYSLAGHRRTAAGARVTCVQCHPDGLGQFRQSTCIQCHTTINPAFMSTHEKAFGLDCLSCHNGSGVFGADFDHSKLPFQLTGKHSGLACNRCHTDMSSLAAFQRTPQRCYSCHAQNDAHKGAFGQQCEQCHTTSGWDGATFNHAIFPVSHGSDRQVATCRTCHPTQFSTYTCYGCHEHTPATVAADHEGRNPAALTDCIRCHAGGSTSDN